MFGNWTDESTRCKTSQPTSKERITERKTHLKHFVKLPDIAPIIPEPPHRFDLRPRLPVVMTVLVSREVCPHDDLPLTTPTIRKHKPILSKQRSLCVRRPLAHSNLKELNHASNSITLRRLALIAISGEQRRCPMPARARYERAVISLGKRSREEAHGIVEIQGPCSFLAEELEIFWVVVYFAVQFDESGLVEDEVHTPKRNERGSGNVEASGELYRLY